jgi:integrase
VVAGGSPARHRWPWSYLRIDPRSDHRLHDARHTTATVLLLLGAPLPAVMTIMGWSNAKVAKRYWHITAAIQNNVAAQVNTLLWEAR